MPRRTEPIANNATVRRLAAKRCSEPSVHGGKVGARGAVLVV